MKYVILTNEEGESLGKSEVKDAHVGSGQLHKAFSIFVFNPDKTKLLIQRRAPEKMLFAGLWANTCCSHPREEASLEEEAQTRLQEECGFTCELTPKESFIYRAEDKEGSGSEYEYDTILIGTTSEDTPLKPDPKEASDLKWVDLESLQQGMQTYPEAYAPWFRLSLPKALHD